MSVRHDTIARMTVLGLIFPPDRPPEQLQPVAAAADAAGLEQLWLWEDCFQESGIATAAAVLAWTERLTVGIGLLPVPLRNVALTAMEFATLERLFPGRLLPGVGHGVLDWMGQVGARAESPMTLLAEYTTALRDLLHGREVTVSGRYVHLDGVRLDWPPDPAPPLLVGAVRPKTARLAGELADGVILTGETQPEALPELLGHVRTARPDGPDPIVVAFVSVDSNLDAEQVASRANDYAAAGTTHVALLAVGDDEADLADYAGFVAREVRPLVECG